jgi:hypothetical protein
MRQNSDDGVFGLVALAVLFEHHTLRADGSPEVEPFCRVISEDEAHQPVAQMALAIEDDHGTRSHISMMALEVLMLHGLKFVPRSERNLNENSKLLRALE